MTNILNLDELAIARQVILGGKSRKLNSMSVEQFIESDAIDKRMAEAKTGGERVKILVEQIASYIEETTEEELKKLTLEQLFALLAFIRGTDAEGNPVKAPAAADKAAEGNAEAPKSSS